MLVTRHLDIEKDLKNLKRFSSAKESLCSWERLFSLKGIKETPGIDLFSGFGNENVYKGRVVPLRENIGKSKGYRVIFQKISENEFKIIFFGRHGIYKTERELINIVHNRLNI